MRRWRGLFRKMIVSVIGAILMLGINSIQTAAGPGSCETFNFPRNPDNKVDWPHTVKVIRQDTLVYQEAISPVPVGGVLLNFNKALHVMDVQGSRAQVRYIATLEPFGWVERSALLCALAPLKSKESGLEQKMYIKTATEVRGEKPATVKAYHNPDLRVCQGECQELSRFTGYFVFDEEPESYLLSDTYRVDETTQLIGWVNKKNGFLWDTAYGLRPSENLTFPKGHPLEGQERAVCAYPSLADAMVDQNCQPILGGKRWYRYPLRIPLLSYVDQNGKSFYKVVLPLAGIGVDRVIEPGKFVENPGIQSLLEMKQVDVLFLIDGTKSLKKHIEAIRGAGDKEGVVQQIIATLEKDEAFKEAQFRFGFRIYRDTYAAMKELGEGLPLSGDCLLTKKSKEENIRQFQQAIQQVEVTDETNDDYPENLFGGIRQAIRDLSSCSNHTKVLFIIGDCGYDANAQRNRGISPLDIAEIVQRLKGEKNIVTFFLQTPKSPESVNDPGAYEAAYNLFTEQAREILAKILPRDLLREQARYLITTDDVALNDKIIAGIKGFSNAALINEIVLDLRGGTALVDAIQRLQGSAEYYNIPGLFWDLVKQGSCDKLGEQCQHRVYDTILEGYIPVSEDIVEDVWLKSSDLDKWISLLSRFQDENLSSLKGADLREAFVFALRDSLETVLRKPQYEETGESLEVYLQRKSGLPVRDTSPLLRYSIADLRDDRTVPDCEITRLVTWVNNIHNMLSIVYHGDLRPLFSTQQFPGECPTGESIPYINGDIQGVPLGNDPTMRYDYSFQKAHVYWVPKEYLP